jgi:hypothetical protein
MFVASREGFGGEHLYFQNNENDSPKWTTSISEAMRFATKKDAVRNSDKTGLYKIIPIQVEK